MLCEFAGVSTVLFGSGARGLEEPRKGVVTEECFVFATVAPTHYSQAGYKLPFVR